VEVPRVHDVGTALRQHADRFPPSLRAELPEVASISRRLGRERELSSYGDEESDTPPQELYTEADADQASADAEKVLGWARQALAAL
jgi:HEPN domain-containing protein